MLSKMSSLDPQQYTNKCIPSSGLATAVNCDKISADPEINAIFELPNIKNQIGESLDCFWCEHGQLIHQLTKTQILDLPTPPTSSTAPVSGSNDPKTRTLYPLRAEFTIVKNQCACYSKFRFWVLNENNIKAETPIYPIPFRKRDLIEVGVDEVGRGCLFGPVTSGAVIWPPDLDNETTRRLIKDSKKLTEPQREEAYAYIVENAISWGVASLDNHRIDEMNILRAAIKTMHMAIDNTFIIPDHVIADGNKFNIYTDRKGEPVSHTTFVQGDNKYYSIAAASILAKVTRDRAMIQLELEHPELARYGIGSNKGYGAPIHLDAIKKYGVTEWHRRSFGPCK